MTKTGSGGSPRRQIGPVAIRILSLLIAVSPLLWISCRKKEAEVTAQGGPAAASPAAPKPTELPAAPGPSFKTAADKGAAAFEGLLAPSDVAVDDKGRVWVVEQTNSALRLFDANGGALGGWGGRGSGQYGMRDPSGIAVRGDDVYIADTYNTGVEVFSSAGQFKAKSSAGLYNPKDVAVAADGRVWIADSGNGRLVLCDADLGKPRTIGKQGSGPEEFLAPIGIAVGPSGLVYVADAGNGRIQVLDSNGGFKSRFKFPGWGANAEPYLDVDSDDSLYVSDPIAGAVVRLDRNGRESKRWTADDAGKKLLRPRGVSVDRRNRVLYVVNTDANTISRIKLEK
jgi:DNA-binding beta-propeller fold protein YncE